ncbi:MAG: hypothetical protein WBA57_05520 [Elainellaceae cyanobacterium]
MAEKRLSGVLLVILIYVERMSELIFRKAILRHQRGNNSANLIWGPPLPEEYDKLIENGCKELHKLGYFANPFPEGDGITLKHPKYLPNNVLTDVRSIFPWLDTVDGVLSTASLYGDEIAQCTILVPVERLLLTVEIEAKPYRFIPALSYDSDPDLHPWLEYLSASTAEAILEERKLSEDKGSLGISRVDILLTYPLVEALVSIPYSEICTAHEYPDGMSPLLRRCSDYADRGVDLLRLEQCDYQQLERLPGIAGQLLDGFHAAYVIPPLDSPFKPRLYCHLVSPFQVIPNWLGLDIETGLSERSCDLGQLICEPSQHEMYQRVRGAVRAIGQAFYMLTPESRFLSLVFALDGICSPKRRWTGIAHHAYIAAVGADEDSCKFNSLLQEFYDLYSNVRNPIVHRGSSFIELNFSSSQISNTSNRIMSLLYSCINTIIRRRLTAVDDFRDDILRTLQSQKFQIVLRHFVDKLKIAQPNNKSIKMPKW